jgi:hypothetical protein
LGTQGQQERNAKGMVLSADKQQIRRRWSVGPNAEQACMRRLDRDCGIRNDAGARANLMLIT